MQINSQLKFYITGILVLAVVVVIFLTHQFFPSNGEKNHTDGLTSAPLPEMTIPNGWHIANKNQKTITLTNLPAGIEPTINASSTSGEQINPATLGFSVIDIMAYEMNYPSTEQWIASYVGQNAPDFDPSHVWSVVGGSLVLKEQNNAVPAMNGLIYYLFKGDRVYVFELTPFMPNVSHPIVLKPKDIQTIQSVVQNFADSLPVK